MLCCEANQKLVEESKELLKLTEDYPTYVEERRLFSAVVTKCDKDLNLELDCGMTIPKLYVSRNLNAGFVKPAEATTRVGKIVNFILIRHEGKIIPSRYDAQMDAVKELDSKPLGTILTGVVTSIAHFGTFVDVGSGVVLLLPRRLQTIAHTLSNNIRFPIGSEIRVVLHRRELGRYTGTTIPLLGTFEENVKVFLNKPNVFGKVVYNCKHGLFIEIGYNLVGLVENTTLNCCEGDYVKVRVCGSPGPGTKLRLKIERTADEDEMQNGLWWSSTAYMDRIVEWKYSDDFHSTKNRLFVNYKDGVGLDT